MVYPGTAMGISAALRGDFDFWQALQDVGVGVVHLDDHGARYLRKYRRDGLSHFTLTWLQQQRVPGYMFGIAPRASAPMKKPPGVMPSHRRARPEQCDSSQCTREAEGPAPGGSTSLPCKSPAVDSGMASPIASPTAAATTVPTVPTLLLHAGTEYKELLSDGYNYLIHQSVSTRFSI